MWVTRIVEKIIENDYDTVDIFKSWFRECRFELKIYTTKLTYPCNGGRDQLAAMLRRADMPKYLRMWNAMESLGRMSSPLVGMEMDLDRLSPEVVIELVGYQNWDWDEKINSEIKGKAVRFGRVEFSRVKKE